MFTCLIAVHSHQSLQPSFNQSNVTGSQK